MGDLASQNYIIREGEVRSGAIVELDGHWFQRCTFIDCTLIFRGIKPFGYAQTQFPGCRLQFEGAALLTLDRVAAMVPDIIDPDRLVDTLRSLVAGKVTLN